MLLLGCGGGQMMAGWLPEVVVVGGSGDVAEVVSVDCGGWEGKRLCVTIVTIVMCMLCSWQMLLMQLNKRKDVCLHDLLCKMCQNLLFIYKIEFEVALL